MFLLFEFFDKVRKTTGFRRNCQEKYPKKFPGRGVLPPLIKIDVGIAHAGGYTPAHIPWLAGPVSVPGSTPPPYVLPHAQYTRGRRKLQGGQSVCNTVVTLPADAPGREKRGEQRGDALKNAGSYPDASGRFVARLRTTEKGTSGPGAACPRARKLRPSAPPLIFFIGRSRRCDRR